MQRVGIHSICCLGTLDVFYSQVLGLAIDTYRFGGFCSAPNHAIRGVHGEAWSVGSTLVAVNVLTRCYNTQCSFTSQTHHSSVISASL